MTIQSDRSIGLYFVASAALLMLAVVASGMVCAAGVPMKWPALTLAATSGHRQFVTTHQGVFNGHHIIYQTTVAETIVKSPTGKPAANIFTFAYTATGKFDPVARPVLFIFNGGPGAASNMFLLGAFGPRRMRTMTVAAWADPSVPLVSNPFTVLDSVDLVFIDAPDTGFSRMLPGAPADLFHSVDGDAYAFGQVILHWLETNGRMASPKYIIGESYGTLRAVVLARDLSAGNPAVNVNGVILVSQAITYQGDQAYRDDPIRDANRLPGMAAVAWYWRKIDRTHQTLQQAVESARVYARTGYIDALLRGNRLTPAERRGVATRLQTLTGIPASYYLVHGLRIADFREELLRSQHEVLNLFDGRQLQPMLSNGKESHDYQAQLRGLTANMRRYATEDLGVHGLGDYVGVVPDADAYNDTWIYARASGRTLDVVLSDYMRAHPQFRLMVTQGIFDAEATIGATEYTIAQLDVPDDQITMHYYPGGHILYSDRQGLAKFNSDVRAFISGSSGGNYPAVQLTLR